MTSTPGRPARPPAAAPRSAGTAPRSRTSSAGRSAGCGREPGGEPLGGARGLARVRCRAPGRRRRSRAARLLAARARSPIASTSGRDVRSRANARRARFQTGRVEQAHARVGLRGARVHLERASGGQRLGEPPHRAELDVERRRRRPPSGTGHDVAALEAWSRSTPTRFAATRATGHARASRLAMRLQRADARAPIAGLDRDLVADGEAATGERARHHGAGARDREGAIDEQAHRRRRAAAGASSIIASSAARSSSRPSPVTDETATTGASASDGAVEPLARPRARRWRGSRRRRGRAS